MQGNAFMLQCSLSEEKKGGIVICLHIKPSVPFSHCGLASHLSPMCVCVCAHARDTSVHAHRCGTL